MLFTPLPLAGAFLIETEPHVDSRGIFARMFCAREFAEHGLESRFVQCSVSHNARRGTLRGMHYQVQAQAEAKLVRCTAGAIYDVILDLRRGDGGYGKWTSVVLSAENRNAVYIPRGVAHGFQTLADDSEVFYQISEFYKESAGRGVRWNDPKFGIEWPVPRPVLSDRDASYPDLD
jgi:dTDP-4-dehydrorhamnose 3,5-epimerase